jgi:putative redox protein
MISILKKNVKKSLRFKAEKVRRVQVDEAKPFKDIHLVFYLEGKIKEEKQQSRSTFFRKILWFSKH